MLNATIKIIDRGYATYLTDGKIYEIKDGYFIADDNERYPLKMALVNFNSLDRYFGIIEDGSILPYNQIVYEVVA